MKNSDFSNFDCDPEMMLEWLQHHGNLQWIPPHKNTIFNFFFHKKKKFLPTSQNGRLSILRTNLGPLSGIENFFFSKFNLLVWFFGVKFAGNYHVAEIIT